jgi:hypothetical protein
LEVSGFSQSTWRPGFEGGDRPLGVQGVGQRDVNRVERTVGDQVGIGWVNSLYARPPGQSFGASRVACSNTGELDFVDDLGRLDDRLVRDVSRSNYAEPHSSPPLPAEAAHPYRYPSRTSLAG